MKTKFKGDLDQIAEHGCGTPGCGHDHSELFLHARCHIHAGLAVSYVASDGELRIMCGKCGVKLMRVAVAERIWVPVLTGELSEN